MISATSLQVILGAHNPMTTESTQVRFAAQARIVHAQWNPQTISNDLALLKISAISIGPRISAISLAFTNSINFTARISLAAGSTVRISGWGRTCDSSKSISSELMFVDVPVIPNAVCKSSYGSMIQSEHICTAGAVDLGSCGRDTGGPLVLKGTQIGIVSFGSSSCQSGPPSAFARVSHFRSSI